MALCNFNRRFGLAPGLRLNLSKSGASVSLGEKGRAHHFGQGPEDHARPARERHLVHHHDVARTRPRAPGGARWRSSVRGAALLLGGMIGLALLTMIASYGG